MAQSQKDLTEATETVESMKAEAKLEQRKTALTEAGFDTEDESVVALFSLEDETFDSVVAIMTKKKAKDEKKEKEEEETEADSKEQASEEEAEAQEEAPSFDNVESSEATLIESEEVDMAESARANISEWLTQNVLKT